MLKQTRKDPVNVTITQPPSPLIAPTEGLMTPQNNIPLKKKERKENKRIETAKEIQSNLNNSNIFGTM